LTKRNKILDLKYKREAMELARARDELIERELVIRQLTYLMINTRQRLLALPGTMRARFGEAFSSEMINGARELLNEALTELSEMPRTGLIQIGSRAWQKRSRAGFLYPCKITGKDGPDKKARRFSRRAQKVRERSNRQ
jgi:hypothetical protein